MSQIHIPKISMAQIHQEGIRVQVTINGNLVLDLPWDAALEVGRAVIAKAHKAEELAKAEAIVNDQALLMRAGVPIGLSANPEIMKEAAKEAVWNTELRRAIPSIKSAEKFGVPMLRQGPPKAQRLGVSGIPSGEKFGKM